MSNNVQWNSEWITEEEAQARIKKGWTNNAVKKEELTITKLGRAVPARKLRADVMQVYEELGGATYLAKMARQNPDLFYKLLLKILPQAVEQDVKLEAQGAGDIKEMSSTELKQLLLEHAMKTITLPPTENDTDADE
jgi:hypothetical protein